jgi:hypothetical protein
MGRDKLFEFFVEGGGRALAQSEQANEDVLCGVFVGEEGFPAAVGDVVSTDEFDLLRGVDRRDGYFGTDFMVDFLHANFASSHVSTGQIEVFHALESQLAQVAVIHS